MYAPNLLPVVDLTNSNVGEMLSMAWCMALLSKFCSDALKMRFILLNDTALFSLSNLVKIPTYSDPLRMELLSYLTCTRLLISPDRIS
jgi:hypothetical protein